MMDKPSTETEYSAGGVAFRRRDAKIDIALISVGEPSRWQLPKGMIGKHESSEEAAMREVQEEAGLKTELIAPIDEIDYWFYINRGGRRVRIHKFVRFYLLRYLSGDPQNHDQEVNEARWVDLDQAEDMLAFKNEREIVQQARQMMTNQ